LHDLVPVFQPFFDRAPEEIDTIIEACVDGFQESMQRQALEAERKDPDDPLPF